MPQQTLESKPVQVDINQAASGVFLSPRVVDARAFDEYSAQLRELLETTASRAAQITRATEHSHQFVEQSAKLGGAMHTQLLKLNPAIKDARELSKTLHALGKALQQREQNAREVSAKLDALGTELQQREQDAREVSGTLLALGTELQQRELDARDAQSALALRICEAEQRHQSITKAIDNGLAKLDAAQQSATKSVVPEPTAPVERSAQISPALDAVLERLSDLELRLEAIEQSPKQPESVGIEPMPTQEHAALRETIDKIAKERALAQVQLDEARALRTVLTNAKQHLAAAILQATDAADRAQAAAQTHKGLLAASENSSDSLGGLLKQSNEVHARLERTLHRAGKPSQ